MAGAHSKPVWFIRLSEATGLGPLSLFVSISAFLFFFTMWLQADLKLGLTSGWFYEGASTPLGNALLIGYVVAVVNFVLPRAQHHLDDVRPYLDLDEEAFVHARQSLISDSHGWLWWIALVCVPFSLLVNYLEGNHVYRLIWNDEAFSVYMTWRTLYQYLTWTCLIQVTYLFVKNAQLFRLLGERNGVVNLLQVDVFAPFFYSGLDNTILIMGGWLIPPAVYLLTGTSFAPQTVAFGLVVFGFATAYVVIVPTKGIRDRIRSLKRRELEEIRQKISAVTSQVSDHREQLLTELVNYRGVVENVRTWPVSLPFFVRFAASVFIPPFVWIAGAVAETFVERLLP